LKIKRKCGRVRFIAPVLKTDEPKGSVSSNLTASANLTVADNSATIHSIDDEKGMTTASLNELTIEPFTMEGPP
jgi:hypothetical protein